MVFVLLGSGFFVGYAKSSKGIPEVTSEMALRQIHFPKGPFFQDPLGKEKARASRKSTGLLEKEGSAYLNL